jgi:hypothetical protein
MSKNFQQTQNNFYWIPDFSIAYQTTITLITKILNSRLQKFI